MIPVSYLLSVSTSRPQTEMIVAIFNTAGRGHVIFGTSNEEVSKTLWLIPKGQKNKEEVARQLQAISREQQIAIVALHQPLEVNQVTEIRALFNDFNLDPSDVTDGEISLFINSQIERTYSHYIDIDHTSRRSGQHKVSIKRLEDHPQFSPDWLKAKSEITEYDIDRDITIDDIEVRTVSFELSKEEPEPPPPPPSKKKPK